MQQLMPGPTCGKLWLYLFRDPDLIQRTERRNYLKGIPNNWCYILKQQCTVCPTCKKGIRNEYHMETFHHTEVFNYKEVWENIKGVHENLVGKQRKKSRILSVKRTRFLEFWKPRLETLYEDTATKFKSIYKRST